MKQRFIDTYNKYVTRIGADKLLEWLKTTDFFEAPASTKYHLSCPGGLVQHSLNVFERLMKLCEAEEGEYFKNLSKESIAIVALLHDICKVHFYALEMRNRKNAYGEWEKYPCYVVDDKLPYGHGEKSVYIISSFMKLTRDEAFAIRWHMGYSDSDFKGGGHSVSNAFNQFPLAVMAHIADLMASHIDEADL